MYKKSIIYRSIQNGKKLFFPILLGYMIISTFSCAYFKSKKRMDLTPFAENMIAIAGDIQSDLMQKRPVYLREFVDVPSREKLIIYTTKIRVLLRETIAYSLEIVTLAQAKLTGQERAEALATYLNDLLRPVLNDPAPELNFTNADLDTILKNIRIQRNLFDALNAAQPVINEIARASGDLFEETKEALDSTAEEIRQRIINENQILIEGDKSLRNAQMNTVTNIKYLSMYRRGNKAAMDSLLTKEPSLKEVIKSTKNITMNDLQAIENRMIFILNALHDVREQLTPDLEIYWKQQKELDDIYTTYNIAIRKAKIAIIVWSRAHQRLAAGVTDPAKIDVFGIAKKAAGTASPL
jgi:hypothetical protein